MTERELREYRCLLREISELNKRIEKEKDKPIEIVSGKVKASMAEFPYTQIRVGVQMENPEQAEISKELITIYKYRREQAEIKKIKIEQYINTIPDAQTRLIFQYRFIDGLSQIEIAEMMDFERSSISKKISHYLQLSHDSHK